MAVKAKRKKPKQGKSRDGEHLFNPKTDKCIYCDTSAPDDAVENQPCFDNLPDPIRVPYSISYPSARFVVGGDSVLIADTYADSVEDFGLPTPAEAAANAKFIVRACNSHATMLEALQGVLRDTHDSNSESVSIFRDTINACLAAVRKADGKE